MAEGEGISRRAFLRGALIAAAGTAVAATTRGEVKIDPDEIRQNPKGAVIEFLAHSGIYTPITPAEIATFYRVTKPLKENDLAHATVYPISDSMQHTVVTSFPRLSIPYLTGQKYSFAELVDLTNKNKAWPQTKDGSWANGICLVSTVTVRALEYARRHHCLGENDLQYTPHFPKAHPAAKLRLLNQWMDSQRGYETLRLFDAGVFFYQGASGEETLIDITWTPKKDFNMKLTLWNTRGQIVNQPPANLRLENMTNAEVTESLRRNFYLTSQVVFS